MHPTGDATAGPTWPVESSYLLYQRYLASGVSFIPEIENSIVSVLPLVPLHVTTVTEATTAVIRNVDSSISTPLSIVFLVSLAVTVASCYPPIDPTIEFSIISHAGIII
jgi:hypothetical protein